MPKGRSAWGQIRRRVEGGRYLAASAAQAGGSPVLRAANPEQDYGGQLEACDWGAAGDLFGWSAKNGG